MSFGDIQISTVIAQLEEVDLLPAIIFRSSRQQCNIDAERAAKNRSIILSDKEQKKLYQTVCQVIEKYNLDRELITEHPHFKFLLRSGVGAHHAGQLLVWRLLLEELMSQGALRVLLATGTVAAGVDFPARTVVITAHTRRGTDGFERLSASEFQQMSGRAGRRGRDTVGFCLAAPSRFCDAKEVALLSKSEPEPLKSAYFPSPSTVLNLLRYRNVDDLRYTVEKSLASFHDLKESKRTLDEAHDLKDSISKVLFDNINFEDGSWIKDLQTLDKSFSVEEKKKAKKIRRLIIKSNKIKNQQIEFLEQSISGLAGLGYLEGLSLSTKGYWAANLCTSYVLEISELINSGIFDDVSAERLVAILASICGDDHRRYLKVDKPFLSKEDLKEIESKLKPLQDYQLPGVNVCKKALPDCADTVVRWMYAEDWTEFRSFLLFAGVAEGDAARLITQVAEQLGQIAGLYESHPNLALRAEEAKRKILRPPLTEVVEFD